MRPALARYCFNLREPAHSASPAELLTVDHQPARTRLNTGARFNRLDPCRGLSACARRRCCPAADGIVAYLSEWLSPSAPA